MDISGRIKTWEIQKRNLTVIDAMDYEGDELIKLSDGNWYYHDKDIIASGANGGYVHDFISHLKAKHKAG